MENKIRKLLRFAEILFIIAGWIMSAVSYVSLFSDVKIFDVDWRIALGIGLFVAFVGTIFTILDLYKTYVWSENPTIHLVADAPVYISNDAREYHSFILSVFNDENLDISECFATLEYAADIYVMQDYETKIVSLRTSDVVSEKLRNTDRIKWLDRYSHERCETTISAKSPKTLEVAGNLVDFGFNLGEGIVKSNILFGAKLHILKIRIDGKFNGKNIKHRLFDGYIYIDGEKAFFRSGNWRKDTEISRSLRETATQQSVYLTASGVGMRARFGRFLISLGNRLAQSGGR